MNRLKAHLNRGNIPDAHFCSGISTPKRMHALFFRWKKIFVQWRNVFNLATSEISCKASFVCSDKCEVLFFWPNKIAMATSEISCVEIRCALFFVERKSLFNGEMCSIWQHRKFERKRKSVTTCYNWVFATAPERNATFGSLVFPVPEAKSFKLKFVPEAIPMRLRYLISQRFFFPLQKNGFLSFQDLYSCFQMKLENSQNKMFGVTTLAKFTSIFYASEKYVSQSINLSTISRQLSFLKISFWTLSKYTLQNSFEIFLHQFKKPFNKYVPKSLFLKILDQFKNHFNFLFIKKLSEQIFQILSKTFEIWNNEVLQKFAQLFSPKKTLKLFLHSFNKTLNYLKIIHSIILSKIH